MEYLPVLTKVDFVRRYKSGEFGNHSSTWNTVEEWGKCCHSFNDRFHIRSRLVGGPGTYNVKALAVEWEWSKLKEPKDSYISSMAPHHKNLIQGELLVDAGWYLTYSDEPDLPMRDALAKSTKTATGIMALALVRSVCNPTSWDWLQVLIERYEGHCIEFSAFRCNWGTIPNENVVWWEIRKY